jgi:hypothetical protein
MYDAVIYWICICLFSLFLKGGGDWKLCINRQVSLWARREIIYHIYLLTFRRGGATSFYDELFVVVLFGDTYYSCEE